MQRNVVRLPKIESSFLSCEKDAETIIKKLFVESQPHSDMLKRLLVINTDDCLESEDNEFYNDIIKNMSVAKLKEKGYLRLEPKIRFPEHEEIKSYILISFDNFSLNSSNPEFRDCTVNIDIICHTDYWDIGNYRLRPLKIAGYIDGLLNKCKLSGIGTFIFLGCDQLVLDENLSGYTLSYRAVHMVEGDDSIYPAGE